ncbi:MAG TPA: carbamoyltransferase C-terminal domain-containing protein, partial [Dongiaceae bacterium]|nr:carbamoyltransferase C-terminal domain-containing protein [Dongiaceae bacterium]
MLYVVDVKEDKRALVPAITHVDGTGRLQTVRRDTNPRYHRLIRTFEQKTGYGVIVNTSFNVRGEPIVCSPEDAYRCFMRTEMDALVLENCVLLKSEQQPWQEGQDWRREFTLD